MEKLPVVQKAIQAEKPIQMVRGLENAVDWNTGTRRVAPRRPQLPLERDPLSSRVLNRALLRSVPYGRMSFNREK
jgi:hypothetical protein